MIPRKTRILIDPGHGGADPGAVHDGVRECDINLTIARQLLALVDAAGMAGRMTRHADYSVSLEDRCQIEHLTEPDIFLSLHCNSFTSPGVSGLEVFTSIGTTAADAAAQYVAQALKNTFPASRFRADISDGDDDKEANFYVLNNTKCPAMLVEMGFLSDPQERAWLQDKAIQGLIAEALVEGILNWEASR